MRVSAESRVVEHSLQSWVGPGRLRPEAGMVLLAVLAITLVVAGSSAAFIRFMHQQQTRAGARMRTAAALAVAEAGVYRAIGILESTTPNGSRGRTWRPQAFSETLSEGGLEGQFIVSVAELPDETLLITSEGSVGGIVRRLRTRVHLTSPTLLAALYGTGIVRLEGPPTGTFILAYGAGLADLPWVHIASGQGIWLASPDTALNKPGIPLPAGPGPVDAPEGFGTVSPPRLGPLRLRLAGGADLRIDQYEHQVQAAQLRMIGIEVEGVELRAGQLPAPPAMDRAYLRALARANTSNADLNQTAGRHLADSTLQYKRDSLYTAAQFEKILAYLRSQTRLRPLRGAVYIEGGMALESMRLRIEDGTLIVEDPVRLGQRAVLEILHTAATRTLPGLVLLGNADLIVTDEARLRVHGLLYASQLVSVDRGAQLDVVGSVLGNAPGFSFVNNAGVVVIRYDPAVLATPGLRVPEDEPVVGWAAAWEELP